MRQIIRCILIALLVASCHTAKPTVSHTESLRYESLHALLNEWILKYSRMESEKSSIIDTLRNVSLPVESSTNVLPVSAQRSELSTSLAESAAWTDSLGMLHHILHNKTNANLPYRKETSGRVLETDKETSSSAIEVTKVAAEDHIADKTEKTIYVPVERLGGKFFYVSGWVSWIVLVIGSVWYMQAKTKIKPITRIINLVKRIFK